MRVGYFTMPLHPPGADPGRTMADDLEQLVFLDQLGFEEAWVGEHITAEWENIPCPDLFIAQALGDDAPDEARDGRLVPAEPQPAHAGPAHRPARPDGAGPVPLGRGLGRVSGRPRALRARREGRRAPHGHARDARPRPRPLERPEARASTRRRAGASASRSRRRTSRSGSTSGPYQRPHPPIAVAGVTEKSDTLVLAGERGYIPMSINFVPPRVLKTHWASVEAGARQGGRVADRGTWRIARDVFIADTTAEARRQALAGTDGARLDRLLLPAGQEGTRPRRPEAGSRDARQRGHARVPCRQHLARGRPGRGRAADPARSATTSATSARSSSSATSGSRARRGRAPCGCSSTRCSRGCEPPARRRRDDSPARRRRDAGRRDRHAGPRGRAGRLRAQPRPDGGLARRARPCASAATRRPTSARSSRSTRSRGARSGRCCQKVSEAEAMVVRGRPERPRVERGGRRPEDRAPGRAGAAGRGRGVRRRSRERRRPRGGGARVRGAPAGARRDRRRDEPVRRAAGRAGPRAWPATSPRSRGLRFAGLQAYHGRAQHINEVEKRRATMEAAIAEVRHTVDLLKRHGLACETVSAGRGRARYRWEAASGVYTEVQAGSYCFMDVEYGLVEGFPREFEQSLYVLATVMSRPTADRAVVDAGLKALSVDKGMPRVRGLAGVEYQRASDEHGVLRLEDAGAGSRSVTACGSFPATATRRSTSTTGTSPCAAAGSRPSGRSPRAARCCDGAPRRTRSVAGRDGGLARGRVGPAARPDPRGGRVRGSLASAARRARRPGPRRGARPAGSRAERGRGGRSIAGVRGLARRIPRRARRGAASWSSATRWAARSLRPWRSRGPSVSPA